MLRRKSPSLNAPRQLDEIQARLYQTPQAIRRDCSCRARCARKADYRTFSLESQVKSLEL